MKKYTIKDNLGNKKTIFAKDLAHAMKFVDSKVKDAFNLRPGDVYLTKYGDAVYKVLKVDNATKHSNSINLTVEAYKYNASSGKIERESGASNTYIYQKDIKTVFSSMNEAIKYLQRVAKQYESFIKKLRKDSIKDEANLPTTIQALVTDEEAAIKAYEVAIKNLEGKIDDNAMQVLINIMKDERRHAENLYAILNGQVTEKNLEDSKVKDNRKIEYDDDVIKVTLNGKVVFKGYAEEWCDDNFYDNFRWTGSQYEATNSQGKWIVKVVC